jgi:antibiotic biosynthesis monooxygenase (ABM) superfamily enzyme
MYGTIAHMRMKPGMEEQMRQIENEDAADIPGFLFSHMYRMDKDANDYFMVVAFTDKETYHKNAQSPEQHQRYLRYRELLEEDPEWHDGEIVFSAPE